MEETFREDGDASWKRVLADHLPDILEFGFPDIHRQIDWSAGYECLNTELISTDKKDPARRYHVDCLFRVHIRRSGRLRTLLLHIEIQGRREAGFPYRIYRYHVRLMEQNEEEILSLAILLTRQSTGLSVSCAQGDRSCGRIPAAGFTTCGIASVGMAQGIANTPRQESF